MLELVSRLFFFLFCAFSVVSSLTQECEDGFTTSCLLLEGQRPLQVRWQLSAGWGFTSLWQHGKNNPNIAQFVIQRRKPDLKKIIGDVATQRGKKHQKINFDVELGHFEFWESL